MRLRKGSLFLLLQTTHCQAGEKSAAKKVTHPPPSPLLRLYFWVSEKKFFSATDEKLSFFCRRTNQCVTQWVSSHEGKRKINFSPHFLTTAHPKKDRRIPNPGPSPKQSQLRASHQKCVVSRKLFSPPPFRLPPQRGEKG